jgi:hypothetical protein
MVRNYTAVSITKETLLLKVDRLAFLKFLGDFPEYENELVRNAVYKRVSVGESYDRQYKKLISALLSQLQVYNDKKKEKFVSDFMREGYK